MINKNGFSQIELLMVVAIIGILAASESNVALGEVVYVSQDATGDASGTSWENACTTISSGVIQSTTGDEVWVASGRYPESVELKPHVSLYGGFLGGEETREARNWAANETIIDATGLYATVVTVADHTTLDGFTVTGGDSRRADGGGVYCPAEVSCSLDNCTITENTARNGGGIYCSEESSVRFTNSIITNNTVINRNWQGGEGGGVICSHVSSAIFENCTISGNAAALGGGVLSVSSYDSPASLVLVDCTISHNYGYCGGGVFGRNITMTDCSVCENTQEAGGCFFNAAGGVTCYGISTLDGCTIDGNIVSEMGETGGCYLQSGWIKNCTISNNGGGAGGLWTGGFDPPAPSVIKDCTISGNTGGYRGAVCGENFIMLDCTISGNSSDDTSVLGFTESCVLSGCIITGNSARISAVVSAWGASSALTNCVIAGNACEVACDLPSESTLVNCTIAGNQGYGCSFPDASQASLSNCILWNPGHSRREITGRAEVTYSCIEGGWTGMGNIEADPLFVDPTNGDYRLQDNSPCIDAGNPSPDFNDGFFPPGLGAVHNDMGAYGGPGNRSLLRQSEMSTVEAWQLYR